MIETGLAAVLLLVGLRLLYPTWKVYREQKQRTRVFNEMALFELKPRDSAPSSRASAAFAPRAARRIEPAPNEDRRTSLASPPPLAPMGLKVGLGTPDLPLSKEETPLPRRPLLSDQEEDEPRQGTLGF
jgi:hypothetical protein